MFLLILSLSNLILALLLGGLYRVSKSDTRAHERERNAYLMIIKEQNDRLMHLAGRTWQLPPVDDVVIEADPAAEEERQRELEGWTSL